MATIKARRQANGSIRYTAIVRKRVGTTITHREAKTFTHRSAALSWATFETISNWQRSKQTHLRFLERHSIGKVNALTLTPAMLIDHVRSRRAAGAGPATVINDLVWIGVVLRAAKNVKELPVRPESALEASSACRELRARGSFRTESGSP